VLALPTRSLRPAVCWATNRGHARLEASQSTQVAQDTAAGDGRAARFPALDQLAARPGLLAGLGLVAAIAAVLLVHLPVLDHYFFGDDFVPLADVASKSTGDYVRDTFLQQDPTPNWRFLTGLFYLGLYRAFGLDALPYSLTSVLFHTATAALIFLLVRRVTGGAWPAFLAASFFGLTAAPVPTVGQVTAFNNVLAGFLLLLSLVTLYEGLERGRLRWWLAASIASYACAIAANESVAVLAPIPVLFVLWKLPERDAWWRDAREWLRPALVSAPYLAIGGVAVVTFLACRCTEANKEGVSSLGDHLFGNFWIYLGRLLYPIGIEYPGKVGDAHLLGGFAVAGIAALFVARGPALARICVAFLVLALLPYVSITFALAPRYVYLAAIPFSILAALLFAEGGRWGSRYTLLLPAALAAAAFAALAFHAFQTWKQNDVFADQTAVWRELTDGLRERYPALDAGSRVYVRGGPLTHALWQFTVLPAAGETLWHDVDLFSVPEETTEFCARPDGGELYVVDYDSGRFTPVPVTDEPAASAPVTDGPTEPASGETLPAVAVACPLVLP